MSNHQHQHEEDRPRGLATKWVLIGFILIAGYFLFTEHRAHVIQYLPFLLVLACPLMHLFHGHGGDGGHRHGWDKRGRDGENPPRERTEGEGK